MKRWFYPQALLQPGSKLPSQRNVALLTQLERERESSTGNSVIASAVPQAIATCGIEIRTREPRQAGCRTGCTGYRLHDFVTNAISISTSLLSPHLSHDGRKGEWANTAECLSVAANDTCADRLSDEKMESSTVRLGTFAAGAMSPSSS